MPYLSRRRVEPIHIDGVHPLYALSQCPAVQGLPDGGDQRLGCRQGVWRGRSTGGTCQVLPGEEGAVAIALGSQHVRFLVLAAEREITDQEMILSVKFIFILELKVLPKRHANQDSFMVYGLRQAAHASVGHKHLGILTE